MSEDKGGFRVSPLLIHEVEIALDVNKGHNYCFFGAAEAIVHVAKILSYGKSRCNIPIVGCWQN